MKKSNSPTRRTFLRATAAALAAPTIVPASVFGRDGRVPPSERIIMAGIGIGSRGSHVLQWMMRESDIRFVAVCDARKERRAAVKQMIDRWYGNNDCATYRDIRGFLAARPDIDAVLIATGDRWHALASILAMRAGKDVYSEKPSSMTIAEGQGVVDTARRHRRIYQTGLQRLSEGNFIFANELVRLGRLGKVHTVRAHIAPWDSAELSHAWLPAQPLPPADEVDWDEWLGPCPWRPYNEAYHPFKWRGWWDFGAGALGDMACHVLDPVIWALKLKYPTSVWACATEVYEETFPHASIIRFEFPAREGMPAVKVNWYDGGMKPPRPDELDDRRDINQASSNVLFMGTKGVLRCGEYGDNPQLIPYSRMRDFVNNKPPQTLERIRTSHEGNWIEACKGGKPATSNFDYSGPFTEMVVMGNLALKRLGKKLLWDGENMRFTNDDEANKYVMWPARKGWELEL